MIPVAPSLAETEFEIAEHKNEPVNKRVFFLSLQAIFNAIIIGLIAKLLVGLIDLITNISFYGRFSFNHAEPAGHHWGWLVIFVPVIGSIIVGIMARFGSAAIRGHGIPEAMEQVLMNESKIKPIITFLKPISAAISIGTGGPFGAEGPIIATGGALGSFTGQIMHITANERKIILAAGACAGMAAIFGTPLAAVLLAIELLLFEFSPRSIIPVALSCVTGAAMHFALFDTAPVFEMPAIPEPSAVALITYTLLGVIIGVVAAGVSKSVYWIEDAFEHLPVHWMWWPAIGAIAVGVIGYFAPLTMGVGYANISHLLEGSLTLKFMLTLCFLKFLSWAISLGSGTSGGTLAPLLTIGGAFGSLLGLGVIAVFPASGINIPTAALIGMAAMFAGASRALLTSIVFALETTMQPHGLLPVLAACTASYFISFFLMKGSIMTEKIERRGIVAPNSYEPDILQRVTAKDILTEEVNLFSVDNTIKQAREWIKQAAEQIQSITFIIVDEQENYVGLVQRADVFNKAHDETASIVSLMQPQKPYLYPENRVSLAIDIMDKYDTDILPVIIHGEHKKLCGVITHKEVFKAYHKRKTEDEIYERAISLKRQGIKVILKGMQLLGRDQ
jgi:CIC family chloride channel protein